jgi:hypothetical protein
VRPTLQITRQRLADIDGQRQDVRTATLATNHDLARTPVDVVQTGIGDLAGAQAQPGQQQHDGVVAPAGR